MVAGKSSGGGSECKSRGGGGGGGGWLQRHLSLKRKKTAVLDRSGPGKMSLDEYGGSPAPIGSQRCGSAPLLITISPVNSPPTTPIKQTFRRPSCVDGVVPVSIMPAHHKRQQQQQQGAAGAGPGGRRLVREAGVIYEDDLDGDGPGGARSVIELPPPPPQIMASDFDLGFENARRIV